jgi:pilus assembly protein Flp/PilA
MQFKSGLLGQIFCLLYKKQQKSLDSGFFLPINLHLNRIVKSTASYFPEKYCREITITKSHSGYLLESFLERISTMLFAPKEKGQGLVEYAIILALVAIVVIAVMRLLGPKIGNTFSSINNSLKV